MKAFVFILILLPFFSKAETRISIEGNSTSDSSTLTSSGAGSKTLILGVASFSAYKESSIFFSVGMGSYGATEPATTTTTSTFAAIVPFAGLSYFFKSGLNRLFSLGAYYVPSVTASYSETGGGKETWSGSGALGRFSIHPALTSNISAVMSLNYLSMSFSNKSGTSISSVNSFNRNILIPTFGVQINW